MEPGPTLEALGPFDPFLGLRFAPLRDAAVHRGLPLHVDAPALGHPGQVFARVPYPDVPAQVSGVARFPGFHGEIHGWVGWFDLLLTEDVTLRTGPSALPTHCGQTYLPLPEPIPLRGEDLEVRVRLEPAASNRRAMEIRTAWEAGSRSGDGYHEIA